MGPRTEAAITRFQGDNRERADGILCANSPCHRKLTQLAKAELSRRPQSRPKPHLTFDGKRLCWVGPPYNGKCWQGVSGKRGFQRKEDQTIKDVGPLPEGKWRVRQDQYQRFDDEPFYVHLLAPIGKIGSRPITNWPGGPVAWGNNRIWLLPATGTKTHGRENFSIHGGAVPGSAGCVDLTSQMPDFTKHFRSYGADVDLIVKY